MPVGRTTTRSEVRALAMVAIALAVIVGGIAVFVTVLARQGDVEIRLGDDRFDAGNAVDIADEIADNGPILWSDPSGGSRDLVVNHVGDSPETGWIAFDARRPGDPRDCQVVWNQSAGLFGYSCDPTVTFSPQGSGLTQFPVEITEGHIIVDLNASQRASTTTVAATTSSVVISGS